MTDNAGKSPPPNVFSTRRPLFASIQGRLYLLLLCVIIPVMIIQGGNILSGFTSRKENVCLANLEMSRAVAGTFNEFVKDVLRHETAIGINFTIAQPLSATEMNRILELNEAEHPGVRYFHWLSPEGRVIASSFDSVVCVDLSDRDYVQSIIAGKEWTISCLVPARVTGKPIFTISRAVTGKEGNLLGIVMAVIYPEKLEDIFSFGLTNDEAITIFDNNGMAVYRLPEMTLSFDDRKFLEKLPVIGEALEGKEVTGIFPGLDTGEDRLVALSPISSIGWAASVSRSKTVVMAPVINQLLHEVGWFLLIIVAVFMGAVSLSKGISGSIRRLLDHASALGSGELKGPVEESGPVELKTLASAFNTMAEEVRAREKALKTSQERLLSVFEAMPANVYLQAPDYSIRFANRSALEAFGCALEGKRCHEILRGRTVPCEDCAVLRTFSTQTPQQYEWTSSSGKCDSIHIHPFKDVDGSPLVLKLCLDITERKRAQEALRESERKYRELVQNANSAIIRLKADGTITFFNEYAQVFFGYTEEEAIGKHVSLLVPEKEFTGADSTAQVHDVASVPGCSMNNINENIRRDGSRAWMAWTNKAILDESGKVTEILSVGTDITERKKAEEQVRVTLESIADGFIAFNADWQFIYVNAAAERLLDVSRTEVLGRSLWEVFTQIQGTQVESEFRLAAAGEVREFEYFYESWGLWFHSRYYPREGGGISVHFKDITERKLAEAALRESRAKLEAALASMTDVVLISNAEVRLIEFNDAFARWHHRVTSRELHSNTLVEYSDILGMFQPNGEPAPFDMWPIRRALRGEVARDAEYTVKSKETGEAWIASFSSSPIRDQDGGIVGAVLVGRDISKRKRVEEDSQEFGTGTPIPFLKASLSPGRREEEDRGRASRQPRLIAHSH